LPLIFGKTDCDGFSPTMMLQNSLLHDLCHAKRKPVN
jgi:hypothetical protein